MLARKTLSILVIPLIMLLTACSGAGETSNNSGAAVTNQVDTAAPSKPDNLHTVTLLPTAVHLSWNESIDDTEIGGYRVYKNNALLAETSATSYLDNTVTANTEYEYTVVAYDLSGNDVMSDPLVVTTPIVADTSAPAAPANLRSTAISSTSVSLAWNAATDNVGVTAYRVYRGTTLVTATTSLAYTVSGLTSGTSYQFHVDAVDAANNTASSSNLTVVTTVATDTSAPTAPGSLRSTATTSNSISLAWNAATDNVGVTAYRIYRGTTLVTSTTSLAYTVSGLTASTSYQFHVDAVDAAGNATSSSTLTVATSAAADTTAPTAPGNLRSTSLSSSSVTLAWNASTDNVGVTSYRVYRNNTQISQITTTAYTDNTVVSGTSYSYTVRAYDAAGNFTTSSALVVAIPSPANTATASLSWTPPTQNSDDSALTNLSGYVIYYGLTPSTLTNSMQVNAGLTAIVIDSLQSGTTYYFSITAVNSLGVESDFSNIVSKTTI